MKACIFGPAILAQLYHGVLTKDRVTQPALYKREVLRRKTGTDDVLGERLTQRVKDILVFGLRHAGGGVRVPGGTRIGRRLRRAGRHTNKSEEK